MCTRNRFLAVLLGFVLAVEARSDEIDFAFISKAEGGRLSKFYIPSANSGVTIATGVDLGHHDEAWLKGLGLTSAQYQELQALFAPFFGHRDPTTNKFIPLNGNQARTALAKAGKGGNPPELSDTQAKLLVALDEAVWKMTEKDLKQHYDTDVATFLKANYPNPISAPKKMKWDDLPAQAKTVLFSVKHQYGDRLYNMKFWQHTVKHDWKAALRELWNFEDDFYPRRFAEGDLLRPLVPDLPALKRSVGRKEKGAANEPDDVRVIQQLLNDRGLYAGSISGVCDDATIAAIEAFQQSMHLEIPEDGLVEPPGTVQPGQGPRDIKWTFRLLVAVPPSHQWFYTLRPREFYLQVSGSWADGSQDKDMEEGEQATFKVTCTNYFPFPIKELTFDVAIWNTEMTRLLTEFEVVGNPKRTIALNAREKKTFEFEIKCLGPGPVRGKIQPAIKRVTYPENVQVRFVRESRDMSLLAFDWQEESRRLRKLMSPVRPRIPDYWDSQHLHLQFDNLKSTVEERFHPVVVLDFALFANWNYEFYLQSHLRVSARLEKPIWKWNESGIDAKFRKVLPDYEKLIAFQKMLSQAAEDLAQERDTRPWINQHKDRPELLNLTARALNYFSLYRPRQSGVDAGQKHDQFFVNDFARLAFNYRAFESRSANGIVQYLQDSGDWSAIHDPESNRGLNNLSFEKRLEKAQELANEGYFVVIGWKNSVLQNEHKGKTQEELSAITDPYQPGQLAVVLPGPGPTSKDWKKQPVVAYAGMPVPAPSVIPSPPVARPLSEVFSPDQQKQLVIYAYKANVR